MKDQQNKTYTQLLEDTLGLMEQRQDFMQGVLENYGTHRAEVFLNNIKQLTGLIEENYEKLQKLKKSK